MTIHLLEKEDGGQMACGAARYSFSVPSFDKDLLSQRHCIQKNPNEKQTHCEYKAQRGIGLSPEVPELQGGLQSNNHVNYPD
ncbi:MAG: hypothetical protein ACJZ9L_03420 [Coraliomargaritaceae bacterium]